MIGMYVIRMIEERHALMARSVSCRKKPTLIRSARGHTAELQSAPGDIPGSQGLGHSQKT